MSPSPRVKPSFYTEISQTVSSFSIKQKILLLILALIFILSGIGILRLLDNHLLIDVAVPGGSLTEGIIGAPSHINPILAVTDADRDLTELVYSGLMKPGPDGKLIPDLADNYTVSASGLEYTFTLKDNLTWQDGQPITTDDIIYTIEKAQDPNLKNTKRANWEGVVIQKLSNKKIKFVLSKPYAPFLENTTLGILPKHLWQNVRDDAFTLSDNNIKGIGSGPYQVTHIGKGSDGLPSYYDLAPFAGYALGTPKINLRIAFYDNESDLKTAWQQGTVESLGSVSPEVAKELKQNGASVKQIPLPRIFAVFFNQHQAGVLAHKEVRQALNLATDRASIIETALGGYGVAIDSPIPPGSIGYGNSNAVSFDLDKAAKLLARNGWKRDSDGVLAKTTGSKKKATTERLVFSIATVNTPELKATAQILKDDWEKLGAKVTIDLFDAGDLDQHVIRPRKFDALLFGEVIGRDPDLYSFWHSSQRNAPGLNIAQYTNTDMDKLLEDARRTTNTETSVRKLAAIQSTLAKDLPAIFLYSPYYLYIMPDKIKGEAFPSLVTQSERFSSVSDWYINKERIWKMFAHFPSAK